MLRTRRFALGTAQVALFLGFAACGGSETDALAPTPAAEAAKKSTGVIRVTGTVQYNAIEGGCYAIKGDDGKTYEPTNLSAKFRKDGLAVEAEVRRLEGGASICMIGYLVQVVRIRALPQLFGRVGT